MPVIGQILQCSGQTEIYGLFCEFVAPPRKKKLVIIISLGALETHVLLSFLWSVFCKRPVINVTSQILKIAVHKIQD